MPFIPDFEKKKQKLHIQKKVSDPNDYHKSLPQIFQKGKSGNPNGRPKMAHQIPDMLRIIGNQLAAVDIRTKLQKRFPNFDFSNITNIQAMLFMAYYQASYGDDKARTFIAERTEGKIRDAFDITENSIVVDIEGESNGDKNGIPVGTEEIGETVEIDKSKEIHQ